MTEDPEKSPSIETGLTLPQIRQAIRRWEEKAGRETQVLQRKTPPWTPLMDQIQIGVPGQISPEKLDELRWANKPKRIRE